MPSWLALLVETEGLEAVRSTNKETQKELIDSQRDHQVHTKGPE